MNVATTNQNIGVRSLPQNGFIIAVISIAVVFVSNLLLREIFIGYVPMTLFLSSVVIASWASGAFCGVLATFIGALIEIIFFPSFQNGIFLGSTDVIRIVVYLVEGLLISYIFGKFHKAQARIVNSEKQLSMAICREKEVRIATEKALQNVEKYQEELNRKRETAKQANHVKTLFLAHMSHEIRTPLMAILGFTDLLKDTHLSERERDAYLHIIERTGNNLKDIINDILDISKVEAGHFEIDSCVFSLRNLIQEVYSVLSLKCTEKNVELTFCREGEVPDSIVSDPKRLRQILINLVGNAVKFTESGFVKMKYWVEGHNLVFCIQDSGIGISEEQKSHLFENFCQGDNSISRKYAGTGLGLSLSRKLAKMLGGDIALIRSEPCKGSIFELTIKFQNADDLSPAPANCPPQDNNPKFDGKTILVVDDSEDNRFLLERILGKLGFQVFTACDGVQALAKIENQKFDLILMDMQMPVMDGYTAAQQLRERHCATPVIALTAHALKEDRIRCIKAGCDAYLSKPLEKERLYEVLKAHCLND